MRYRRSKLPRANGLALRLAETSDYPPEAEDPKPMTVIAAKERLLADLQERGVLQARKKC